ncbi:MAG: hypothetical protein AB2L14_10070 [Candidatus Xenobiia bacterium LiM19]
MMVREESGKRFQNASLFAIITIGIPFCIYKFLFGILVIRNHQPILGWLIIIFTLSDIGINLFRFFHILAGRRPPLAPCTLAQIGRIFNLESLFTAVDKVLAFSIICFILWSKWVALFSPLERTIWLAGATINFVSLSVIAIWTEIQKLPNHAEQGREPVPSPPRGSQLTAAKGGDRAADSTAEASLSNPEAVNNK